MKNQISQMYSTEDLDILLVVLKGDKDEA